MKPPLCCGLGLFSTVFQAEQRIYSAKDVMKPQRLQIVIYSRILFHFAFDGSGIIGIGKIMIA